MMSEHKDIDQFFQQGSEQHDFDYNPDAWAEMELLMEKEKRSRRFWWWFSGLFVMGIAIFGFLNYFNGSLVLDTTPQQSSTVKEKVEQKPSTNTLQKDVKGISIDKNETLERREIENIQAHPRSDLNKLSTLEFHALTLKRLSKSNAKYANGYFDTVRHTEFVNDALSGKNTSTSINTILQNEIYGNTRKLDLLPSLSPVLLIADAPDIEAFSLAQNDNLSEPQPKSQWLLGVFLASELSSAELENISKNNFRFGGQASFRFKEKFGASIGLSYTQKKYKVNEGDYTPPKGFWTRKIAPQSTEATTEILEVPVLVTFFPKGYEHNGLYSNLGLTSYFMLKEKYRYSYDLSDPDLIRDWHTEKENNHWFGVGQVSVGYQRVMKSKVYAQFGSYVQVPLTGIGHGNVKLWSFGLNWKMNFMIK